MDERIELVLEHKAEHGLNRCLKALGVSKGTWHYRMGRGSKRAERKARDEALRGPVVEVIGEHPSYGYRRIRPEVEEATGEVINAKRLWRLLNEWELNLHRTTARSSPSEVRRILKQVEGHLNRVAHWNPGPLEVLVHGLHGAPVRRRRSTGLADGHGGPRQRLGAWMGRRTPSADRGLALRCWSRTTAAYDGLGASLDGVTVHSDQNAVYTIYVWLRCLLIDSRAQISYSSLHPAPILPPVCSPFRHGPGVFVHLRRPPLPSSTPPPTRRPPTLAATLSTFRLATFEGPSHLASRSKRVFGIPSVSIRFRASSRGIRVSLYSTPPDYSRSRRTNPSRVNPVTGPGPRRLRG